MAVLTMVQALTQALDTALQENTKIVLLGEDIGVDGGVFRVTDGLQKKYGEKRVFDTPLAEAGIIGVSIGLAIKGFKPIPEIQFEGFLPPGFDQIISQAARLRNRTRGQRTLPLVIRTPYGGGVKALEHHSDAPETYYVHTPGIKVVIPSTPYDAKGLLLSAIDDPDPVIFFEPKKEYRAVKQEVPEEAYRIPLGKASIIQEGTDVTIITYGGMVRVVRKALQQTTASVELIDLRTLSPLDEKTILTSVQKTGRALIVHEAPRTLGMGAEISALINEKALYALKKPVQRVTGYDTIIPLPKNENSYYPTEKRVLNALGELLQ